MNRIFVATEDTYGEDFVKTLITKLKQEGIIPKNIKFLVKAIPKRCSQKLERLLKIRCLDGFKKLILLVDGDGQDENKVKSKELEHGNKLINCKLYVIINQYEIEEWFLFAFGKKFSANPKPSVEIKKIIPHYEKHMLNKVLKNIIKNKEMWSALKEYMKFKELLNVILS